MVASTDPVEACKGVDVAVMVGGFPRKGGMERKDVMAKNVSIYKSQADALEKGAKPDVKVTRSLFACLHCWLLVTEVRDFRLGGMKIAPFCVQEATSSF